MKKPTVKNRVVLALLHWEMLTDGASSGRCPTNPEENGENQPLVVVDEKWPTRSKFIKTLKEKIADRFRGLSGMNLEVINEKAKDHTTCNRLELETLGF